MIYTFDVILLLYISLPIWPTINTPCTTADRERFSVFRGDNRVQKSDHLWCIPSLCWMDRGKSCETAILSVPWTSAKTHIHPQLWRPAERRR